jgi:hypothetical protein
MNPPGGRYERHYERVARAGRGADEPRSLGDVLALEDANSRRLYHGW